MARDCSSPEGLGRIATIVLGIAALGMGLYSHYQSFWVKEVEIPIKEFPLLRLPIKKPYELCKLLKDNNIKSEDPCPDISMEHYFVSMIVICFIISLIGLIASCVADLSSNPMKYIELGYHAVAAILLLIAGIVYMISATQIHKLRKTYLTDEQLKSLDVKELTDEKLVAGGITIVEALVYGFTALLIANQSDNNEGNNSNGGTPANRGGNNGANQGGYQQGGNVPFVQPSNNSGYPDNRSNYGANQGGYPQYPQYPQGGNVQFVQPSVRTAGYGYY